MTRKSICRPKPERFGRLSRYVIFRSVTALVCAVLLFASPAGSAAARFKPFKLKTLEGTQTSFADVLGKATLVVFFFPTCTYCNVVLPKIQRLNDTYQEHGLSTVWINVLPQQGRLIPEWRRKRGYTVPILLGGRSIQRDYDLVMTPTHYLFDSQGKVLLRHAGYSAGDERDLERRIRETLGLSPD